MTQHLIDKLVTDLVVRINELTLENTRLHRENELLVVAWREQLKSFNIDDSAVAQTLDMMRASGVIR